MKKEGAGVESVKSVGTHPSDAFDASDASPLLQKSPCGVTVAEILDVFSGATVVATVDPPMPAGHVALFEAGRVLGFPWLRLWRGVVAVGRGEDAWRAWLCHWVSPGALALARAFLARGMALAAPGPGDGTVPSSWRAALEAAAPEWTSSAAQRCCCGGQRWRRTVDGDVCTTCQDRTTKEGGQ
jgi:hypothetical protein